MVEVVVEDLVAVFSILSGEVVAGTDKEEITNHVADHLLVEISVVNVLPVCVLKIFLPGNCLEI